MQSFLDISPATLDDQALRDIGFSTASSSEVVTDALNPAEQRLLYFRYMETLQDAQRQIRCGVPQVGKLNSDDDWTTDYRSKPPSLSEFITDPRWLGRTLTVSDDSPGLFPAWKELLARDFELGSSIHNLVITGSLGIGKCLCYNELCLMFDGSVKPVQDIAQNDLLMGDDSTPRRVMSTMKNHGPVYEIYPAKGEPFKCNAAHILCLKTSESDEIVEVSVEDFLKWPRAKKHAARLYRTSVEWPSKPVRIDPYWLGLWLGDGTARRVEITTMDEALRAYFCNYAESFGLTCHTYSAGKGAKASTYNFTMKGGRWAGENKLMTLLRSYDLSTKESGYEKFIPREYLINSKEVRLQLLAGLLDTDGSKARGGKCTLSKHEKQNNGVYEITSKYERFANQVCFLAQSLGYFARTVIKIVNATAYYRTTISGAYDVPSLLKRKQSSEQGCSISPLTGHVRRADCLKTKFAVIPKGSADYYGFEIDGNHRFLLKDFTVTHNTYVMVVLLLYKLTLATLLINPQSFFGLGKGSPIVYIILSITKAQVQETAFGDAINFMAKSDYFVNECGFDPDSKYSNFRIKLPGDIYLTAGSKGWHALGRNVLGIALDEGNWRNEADPDTKAYELYNEVRIRIQNRFMRTAKFLPAISILASSARDESSFTETVIKEIEAAKDSENQIVYRNAVYKIKKDSIKFSGKWFKVCYGLKTQEPYVLTGRYLEDGTPIESEEPHEKPSQGAAVELVPVEYLSEFKRRTRIALQSIAGISVGGSNRFFPSTIDLERCIELSVSEGVVNPCKPGVSHLAVSMEDNINVWDYLDHNKFLTIVQSRIQPKRHPEMARFAHLDLATQTLAGLSICHLVGTRLITGLSDAQGNPFSEYRLIVEYDFILTICAGRIKPISLEKIQNFIFWLRDKCGMRFVKVTADQFASAMPLQMLESRGIPSEILSVDRDNKVYTAWRQASEELRLRMYRQDTMMTEAENLLYVDGNKKVDHPKDGSKDTSDSAAGAYFNAIMSEEKLMVAADNNPGIVGNQYLTDRTAERPIIDIPLPLGYTKIKSFS